MEFHGKFVEFLKQMYKAPSARIIMPGQISRLIKLHRGTGQGCPLSPLLFNLALEPLARYILQSKDINGIKIRNEEIKIALFADDVLMFISNPDSALTVIQDTLEKFGSFQGSK